MKHQVWGFGIVWVFLPFMLWGRTDPFVEMADDLLAKTESRGVHRVAVLEFKMDNSSGPVGGRLLQDRLISAFVKRGTVSVVERDRLDELKKELTLGMTGLMDDKTTKQIGKVLGVDGLVLGSISVLGKGTLEVNTRLVLVETGEILGASTKEVKKTWLEPIAAVPRSADPLEGWKDPLEFENSVSTTNAPGTVLYKNPFTTDGSAANIIQIALVKEDRTSATFDVDYDIPPKIQGRSFQINLFSGYPFATGTPIPVGKQTVRINLSSRDIDAFFYATNALNVSISEVEGASARPIMATEIIPFRKIWINPSHVREGYFLKTNPTMRINRVDPLIVSWDKGFVLYGEFSRAWFSGADRHVVVGGGSLYRTVKILEWSKDRIVVDAPASGTSDNPNPMVDPDLPYYIAVVVGEEHSNLFLVKFSPEGLPSR